MGTGERDAIGMVLWSTTQVVNRAFERVLADAGGSRPIWFILRALQDHPPPGNQRELAARVELTEATLTHHLHAMEDAGLVTRVRTPANRRVVQVLITDDGRRVFARMLQSALEFNADMRRVLGPDAEALLRGLRALHDRFAEDDLQQRD